MNSHTKLRVKGFIYLIIFIVGILLIQGVSFAENYNTRITGVIDKNSVSSTMNLLTWSLKGDQVTIYIDSTGGLLYVAYDVMNAMNKATDRGVKVVTVSGHKVMSAATFIYFNSRHIVINKDTIFMFHAPKLCNFDMSRCHSGSMSVTEQAYLLTNDLTGRILEDDLHSVFFTENAMLFIGGAELYRQGQEMQWGTRFNSLSVTYKGE